MYILNIRGCWVFLRSVYLNESYLFMLLEIEKKCSEIV